MLHRGGRRWTSSTLNRWSGPFFAALIAASLLLAYQTRNRPNIDGGESDAFRLDSTDGDDAEDGDDPGDALASPTSQASPTSAETVSDGTGAEGSAATFGTTEAAERPGITVTTDPTTIADGPARTSVTTTTGPTSTRVGSSDDTASSTTGRPSTTTTPPTTEPTTEGPTTTSTTTAPPPPVALVNGDFERLDVAPASFRIVAAIPGWQSATGEFEVWSAAHRSISPASGDRFLELNANSPGSISQDFATTPGTTIRWQFSHRGRTGTETVELQIGPSGGPLTSMVVASTGQAWKRYSGTYTVPAGQTATRIRLSSRSAGSTGNLIDDVSVQLAS